jgi:hypothetical protein
MTPYTGNSNSRFNQGNKMSSSGDLIAIKAQEIRKRRLQEAGLAEQYDLWRENLPDQEMDEGEVYHLFMETQSAEEAANNGRLSVATGGTTQDADTEIPTPGPDDEEGGPDEAGDTSKGPEDRDTEVKIVEGMWLPPEESEAENYEAPSTDQMTHSKDWQENARILHDFMGNPGNEANERKAVEEKFGSQAYAPPQLMINKPEADPMSEEQVGQWARNELSGFNWNVATMLKYAQKIMTSEDPKTALAFLNLINMYDFSDGDMGDFGGALGEIAMDPTTYLGLGVGSVVAKGASKAVAKTGLKKSIQMAIVGATAGAVEGGMLGGGFDLTVQNVEQEAGAREDIDRGRAAGAAGMGAGLGIVLGGTMGRFAGRRMDKFAEKVAEQRRVNKARDLFLEENRLGDEPTYDQLVVMLRDLNETSTGKIDPAVEMAQKIYADGKLPRQDDGSIDYDAIWKVVDEIKAKHKQKWLDDLEANRFEPIEVDRMLDEVEQLVKKGDPDGELGKFVTDQAYPRIVREKAAIAFFKDSPGEFIVTVGDKEVGRAKTLKEADALWEQAAKDGGDPITGHTSERGDWSPPEAFKGDQGLGKVRADSETGEIYIRQDSGDYGLEKGVADSLGLRVVMQKGDEGVDVMVIKNATEAEQNEFIKILSERQGFLDENVGRRASDRKGQGAANEPFEPQIMDEESQKLVNKIIEMEELEKGDVVLRSESRPGSRVKDEAGEVLEVVGRTKNGWYRMRDRLGRERSLRRKSFQVVEKAPPPKKAGPMELDPFGSTAAKVIKMSEDALNPEHKLKEVVTTHKEQAQLARKLEESGIDVSLTKRLDEHWSPAELMSLRDIYNKQANGMAELARVLESQLRNNGVLTNEQLAQFNNAHNMFVATRDLFYGSSGNAARQLNILRSKPVEGVYDFNQSLMDSINLQGGRSNTEHAIRAMADFAHQKNRPGGKSTAKQITQMSNSIWGNKEAAWLLNLRYNMMLSSWRTHFFNFLGNSASGIYHHLMVSPVRMGINNLAYARNMARSVVQPSFKPDPADRLTAHTWIAELRGHFQGARESLYLAKEIAMGRSLGEGKVWNELGLRYNVINVPTGTLGKLGTTPVRLLEAGDAFFKNQYYNSKIHELASINARADEVHGVTGHGKTFKDMYKWHLDNPDGSMERSAKEFAQRQTYTNDTSVYRGLYSVVADSVIKAQNRSVMVNMIIPFVKTPANLLGYSMEAIGLTPSKTLNHLRSGNALERQEAMAKLTIAGGLWFMAQWLHENGEITGSGPSNWEERRAWEAAGWQANSIKIYGNWIDMSRAAPLGQSFATMASVLDYYSMTVQEDKPAMDWLVGGLLYTADAVMDENYLSTVSDMITAISSKQESKIQSVAASTVNSIFVPNLLRDLRRPADAQIRRTAHPDFMGQLVNQMHNATPGYSDNLPPSRDWMGRPMNYYGNAYIRALLPFNVKDSENQDPATMAVAYARIPVSIPDKTIAWPGGLGDSIDLYAMDNGGGYVYDQYLKIMGESKHEAVDILMKTSWWKNAAAKGDIGPNSDGDRELRRVLGLGTKAGRLRMLDFLIKHSGENDLYYHMDNEGNKVSYQIQHPVDVSTYIDLQNAIRKERIDVPDDLKQYIIKKPVEGPEFFKP